MGNSHRGRRESCDQRRSDAKAEEKPPSQRRRLSFAIGIKSEDETAKYLSECKVSVLRQA